MSKPKHARGLADTEAQAILHNIRVSPRKLNLVAAMIRGAPVQPALAPLTLSKRRTATPPPHPRPPAQAEPGGRDDPRRPRAARAGDADVQQAPHRPDGEEDA